MSDYKPSVDELAALQSYAAEKGRTWKAELSKDWYHARLSPCQAMPNRGSILHGLRNHPRFGPKGLERFRLDGPRRDRVRENLPRPIQSTDELSGYRTLTYHSLERAVDAAFILTKQWQYDCEMSSRFGKDGTSIHVVVFRYDIHTDVHAFTALNPAPESSAGELPGGEPEGDLPF